MRSLACLLLCAGCAQLSLTVKNERAAAVKNVQVKAGAIDYVIPRLEPGASDVRQFKVEAPGELGVNYSGEAGGVFYTSAGIRVEKGDGRKVLLKLTEKSLLEPSVEK